jgi:hypothetical protein
MFTRARLAGDPRLRARPPAFQARNFAGVPAVDKDPETYIHQAEQQLRPPAPGSLNIGSVKGQ